MSKPKSSIIEVQGAAITILSGRQDDFISLTDIARFKDERTDYLIQNWLRNRNTIEFFGVWERLNNPDFNPIEFDGIANMEGMNAEFIHMGLTQGERLKRLNQIAIRQMQVLTPSNLKALPGVKENL